MFLFHILSIHIPACTTPVYCIYLGFIITPLNIIRFKPFLGRGPPPLVICLQLHTEQHFPSISRTALKVYLELYGGGQTNYFATCDKLNGEVTNFKTKF